MSPQAPMNGTILRSASLTDHSSSDESYESCEEVNRHYSRFVDANFYKCLESPGQNKELKPSDENWGYPGYLSSSQLSSLEMLHKVANKRSPEFRSTIYTFKDSFEDDIYALCRWLRPNNFNVTKTIRKIEEAHEYCKDAKHNNYYHSPTDISYPLGVEPSIYLHYYPQFYHGMTKKGLPLFYAKAGAINLKAIGCLTTQKSVLQFHWLDMFHKRNQIFKKCYNSSLLSNQSFKRYEILYILDLKNLGSSQLRQIFAMTKEQIKLDELCFPEGLTSMIIINAPSTFTIIWNIIKTWIGQRTAMKVEIFGTNRIEWESRLNELVDSSQLPVDYGGRKGNNTSNEVLKMDMIDQYKAMNRHQEVLDERYHLFTFENKISCYEVKVEAGQKNSLSIFTNSRTSGTLKVFDQNGKLISGIPEEGVTIIHHFNGKDDGQQVSISTQPTRYDLEKMDIHLNTPGTYHVQMTINQRPNGNFVLVSKTYKEADQLESRPKDKKPVLLPSDERRNSLSLGVGSISLNASDQIHFEPYEYAFEC